MMNLRLGYKNVTRGNECIMYTEARLCNPGSCGIAVVIKYCEFMSVFLP